MWLYSVASGMFCAGILLMIGVVGTMLITRAFSGSLFGIFNPRNGIGWPLISMAVVAVLSIAAGPLAFFLLGYQQVDWFVMLLSAFVTWVFALVIYQALNHLTQESYRKKMIRRENEYLASINRKQV